MSKIYFQTCAYNAEKTLKRCVDSVLNQTKYGDDIVYWILDNGSTDNTREMLQEYAKNDSRIRLFYNEKNHVMTDDSRIFWDMPMLIGNDDCYSIIDADDEYKLDYLEKMIPFMDDNDLDIAICGNEFIDAISGRVLSGRFIEQTMFLDSSEKLSAYFPVYHQFLRTVWAKLYRGRISRKVYSEIKLNPPYWVENVNYGTDTLNVLMQAAASNRIGIYPETFYRYYVSKKSTSYIWDNERIESDQILNEETENFLNRYGPISEQNREFLARVYANAVSDSISVLHSVRGMTAEDKLKEIRKVVDYRATSDMMRFDNTDVSRCRRNIFNLTLNFGMELKHENDDFHAALTLLCPNCAPFVNVRELALYAGDSILQNALFDDNMTALVERLLQLISKNSFTKQFDLYALIERVSADRGLVGQIGDRKFIKKHSELFFMLWQKKYIQALDRMTEIMLKDDEFEETFIQVYLTLAAMLESVDEFVLGKVKLAVFYCNQKRNEECSAVLADLDDMGVEDNDEITRVKKILQG